MKKSVISLLVVVALLVTALAVTAVMAGAEATIYTDAEGNRKMCECGGRIVVDAEGTEVQATPCKYDATTGQGCDGTIRTFAKWTETDSLPTSGNYYLTAGVTTTGVTQVKGPAALRLNLNGQTVNLGGHILASVTTGDENQFAYLSIAGSGTVNGADVSALANSVKTDGLQDRYAGVIYANSPMNLYGGIYQNGKSDYGGIIYADTSRIINIFDGVTIQNGIATADVYGGGCITHGGTGTLNVFGATISGGKTVKSSGALGSTGGNIYVRNGATINLYNGTRVVGGQSENGGNIHVNKGTLLVDTGAEVSGGTATQYGGNITSAGNDSNALIIKGTVTGGQAQHATQRGGGNFYMAAGKLYVRGGSVTNGSASFVGGNINARNTSQVHIEAGATISGGTATNNGGEMYIEGASLYMDMNSTASGVVAGTAAAKVYLYDTANDTYATNGASALTFTGVTVQPTYTTGGKTYVALAGENGAYSAHRLEITISKIYLRAAFKNAEDKISPAIYYEVSLKADATLKGEIDAFGVIATQGETLPTSITADTISDEFASGFVPGTTSGEETKYGTMVSGIMTEGADSAANITNAGTKINAAAYVKIGNTLYFGTKITENNTLSDYLKAAAAVEKDTAQQNAWDAMAAKFETELATILNAG